MEFAELNEFAQHKEFRYLMELVVGIAVPNAGNNS
jgi:hypothetical protein